MAEAGSANIKITADDSQARSKVSGFFGFIQKAGTIAAGVAGGMAIFDTVKRGFDALKGSTIMANADMETYLNTLTIVMKSSKKAAETMDWAEKFAAKTPFEIPEIVEATTRLTSYGLNARKVLGVTGDMAAVMGKPLMQAVEAVADAQTGELERLKEFGITKAMLIDQAAKMGMNEVVNAKGQITDMEGFNKALFALMEERFQGGMEIQSKTFKGMLSNAQDSMGTIARELSKPVFDGLKRSLASVLPIMGAFTNFIRGDTKAAMSELTAAFGPDKAAMIMNLFQSLQNGVKSAMNWLMQFRPSLQNIWQIIQNLWPLFKALGIAMAGAFLAVAQAIPPVVEWLTKIVAAITGWEGFIPTITALGSALGFLFVAGKVAGLIGKLKVVMSLLMNPLARAILMTGLWRKAMLLLNSAFLMNPLTLTIAAIIALGVALVAAYKKSETFRNIVNSVWASVKSAWNATLNFFTTTIPAVWTNIVNWFKNGAANVQNSVMAFVAIVIAKWQSFKAGTASVINSLVSGLKSAFQTGLNFIKAILAPFITFFVNSWNNLKLLVLSIVTGFLSLLTGDFEGMRLAVRGIVTALKNQFINIINLMKNTGLKIIKSLWQGAINLFKSLRDGAVNSVNSLKTKAVSAVTSLKNGAINGFKSLKTNAINSVKSLRDSAVRWFNNLTSSASRAVTNTKNSIVNGFNSAKTSAVNKIRELYNSVRDWLGKVPGKVIDMKNRMISAIKGINLRSLGKQAIQGFINGIGDMIGAVKTKVGSVVDALQSKLSSKLKLGSPSRLLKQYGNWTFEGFVIGADDMIGKVQKVAGKIAEAAVPNMDRVRSNLQGLSAKVKTNISGFGSGFDPSVISRALSGLVSGPQKGGTVHHHYWSVNADEINEVQKLIGVINGVTQVVRSR